MFTVYEFVTAVDNSRAVLAPGGDLQQAPRLTGPRQKDVTTILLLILMLRRLPFFINPSHTKTERGIQQTRSFPTERPKTIRRSMYQCNQF